MKKDAEAAKTNASTAAQKAQQTNQAAQTAAQTAQQKDQEAAQLNAAAQQAERAAQQAEAKAQGSAQAKAQAEAAVKEAAAAEAAYQKDAADSEQIEIKVLMKGWEAVSAIMTQFSRNSGVAGRRPHAVPPLHCAGVRLHAAARARGPSQPSATA